MKKFDVICIANTGEKLRMMVKAKNEQLAARKFTDLYKPQQIISIKEKIVSTLHMFNEAAFERYSLEA